MRRLVLSFAVAVTSLMPSVGMADDTQIAEYVKSQLQEHQQLGNLKGFNVDMRVDRGTVWFEGFVSNREQQMTILKTAQKAGHLGVVQVVNDIEVRGAKNASPYRAAAYQKQQSQPLRMPVNPYGEQGYQRSPRGEASPVAYTRPAAQGSGTRVSPDQIYGEYAPAVESYGGSYGGEVYGGEVYGGEVYGGSSYGEPMPFASCADAGVSSGYSAESYGTSTPAPIAYGGGPGGGGGAGPSGPADLPGYAWPSYAAAPNYGALSYPRQHSASAWPYIGPFYPYPQVPLGWRKVTLEWDDGWWHLDFNDK